MHDLRRSVDERFVGFRPNGASIKPVHIANGAMRVIYGQSSNTSGVKKLSYVANANGKIPKGNSLEEVYDYLYHIEAIESEDISPDALSALRTVLQKALSADGGVFGVDDGMLSYSAGSDFFLTRPALYEDAGEFAGGLIKEYSPALAKHIAELLADHNDPISILLEPVSDNSEDQAYNELRHESLDAFSESKDTLRTFLAELGSAGDCLCEHLKQHPNKLMQLRLFNFYSIFSIVRYLSLLEAFYCEGNARPFLIDFTGNSQSSIARSSVMCYTQVHRAISRFYAWGFAQELSRSGYNKNELLELSAPTYKKSSPTAGASYAELNMMWNLAKEDAVNCDEDEALLIFGEAIYDMLALEASSHPVNYLRSLGSLSGILWPPTNFHVNKRFILSQDMLETVLRCCVYPSEVLTAEELRHRLWQRFGIIIGGGEEDIKNLYDSGGIVHADSDSLHNNFHEFAAAMQGMDFAELMADGVLQIRLGGKEE